jgi:hypothetical protein
MTDEMAVVVHEVAVDGLPNMEVLVGRVAFIFDGCIVSGWPLYPSLYDDGDEYDGITWEANTDVGTHRRLAGVTHWVEFPYPLHQVGTR